MGFYKTLVDRVKLDYIVKEIGMSVIFKKDYVLEGLGQFDILFAVPEYKDQILLGTTSMHQKGQMIPLHTWSGAWTSLSCIPSGVKDVYLHALREDGALWAYIGQNLEVDYDKETTQKILLLTDIEIIALEKELKKVRADYKERLGNNG